MSVIHRADDTESAFDRTDPLDTVILLHPTAEP